MDYIFNDLFIIYYNNSHNFNVIIYFLFIISLYFSYYLGLYNRQNSQKHVDNINFSYESEKKKFLDLFEKDSNIVNSNVHPDIYIYEKYQQLLNDENNSVEKQWKTRILIQNTEHKNVIMYYDIFKQSFSYFSDFQLTYKFLNQTAMKYVRIFCCRDFFIDNTITPDIFESPFIKMKEDVIKKEKIDYEEKKKKLNIDFDSDVFVKSKKNNIQQNKNDTQISEDNNTKNIYRNNFCYCGKIQNFTPINKSQFKTKTKLSYKDFKNIKN